MRDKHAQYGSVYEFINGGGVGAKETGKVKRQSGEESDKALKENEKKKKKSKAKKTPSLSLQAAACKDRHV